MVGISLHHVVATMIGVDPGFLFAKVADRLPDGSMATLVREFGAREDITLEAFAWERVDTPDGPDFRPTWP